LVQDRNEIDALDMMLLAVIPVPTDNLVFIIARLVLNSIIKNENLLLGLASVQQLWQ